MQFRIWEECKESRLECGYGMPNGQQIENEVSVEANVDSIGVKRSGRS